MSTELPVTTRHRDVTDNVESDVKPETRTNNKQKPHHENQQCGFRTGPTQTKLYKIARRRGCKF